MTTPVAARHALACQLAREGGAHAKTLFEMRDHLVIEAKANPQDVVSRADREVEAIIRARITVAFPEDAIRGEEEAPRPGTSGFTWVIDPIDGTMPFLSGLPHWCVAIAVVEGEDTVAAATCAPMLGETFDAIRGGGFRVNGTARRAPAELGLQNAMTAIGASHRTPPSEVAGVIERLMAAGGAFYRSGSGALMLAEVAMGRLAGYYEPHMNAWDCIGGILMVEEAGGRAEAYRMDTMLTDGGRVLAACPATYDALVAVVDGG